MGHYELETLQTYFEYACRYNGQIPFLSDLIVFCSVQFKLENATPLLNIKTLPVNLCSFMFVKGGMTLHV